jgi:hypothetical protein
MPKRGSPSTRRFWERRTPERSLWKSDKQTAAGEIELALSYVLSSVTARLLEMQVTRP